MLKLEISLVFIVGNAMNKIFKVIFNKSLGRMVIVSENAKSAGKTTVSGQALSVDAVEKRNSMVFALKPLLLCMSLCIGTQAWADICMLTPGFPDSLGGNNGFLPETLACGYMNSANGINSTSVGVRNSALGNYSNALGYNNTASGAYSSAVGTLNKSIGIGSSAIGSGLKQHGIETYTFWPKTLSFDNFTITTNLPDNESTFTNDSNFTPDIITSINGVTNLSDAAKQAFVSYVKRSSSDDKINQATGIASSALGVVNNAVGLGSSAVGFNNNATGDASAAYGASTSALAQYSSVFGSYSQATAEKATAVGYNSVADRANTISVGKSGAEKQITNVAAGSQSTDAVNKKQMDDSVGVVDSRITTEVGTLDGKITANSNAITGLDGRVTTNEGDIANLQQGQGTLNQLAVQYDTATQDVITLKGTTGTKITNLKNGDISTVSSKDAVTGGQLYTTNQDVAMLSTQATAGAQQITSILGGGATYSRGVFTLPTFSIQGKSYSNIGDTFGAVNTEISTLKTSVTNLKAYVDQQNSGSESNLKSYIDQQDAKNITNAKSYTDQQASNTLNSANTYTDQQDSATLNSANTYTDQQTSAVLKDANAYTDRKVLGINTGTGNTSGTGINSTAIGPNTVVSGNNSTAVGVGNNVSGNNSGAFGDPNIVTANGSYVVGNDNTVSGDNTFVLGNNVNTSAKNSVVLGNDSTSTRDNTVSVGSSGNERQITNVADATEKTDAVNLRQMQAANTETLKSSKEYTDTRVSTLESSFSDFSYQTDRRFKEVDKRFDRQGAMSAAMMNMATSTAGLKGLNRVGVAAGFQGDEKAVAIGYQRIVSENVSLSVGGAFTDEDGSGGAGVGFSW